MTDAPDGPLVVIFRSKRPTGGAEDGYAQVAAAMAEAARGMPGFLGMESLRDAQGEGVTLSRWADEASLKAWAEHPGHRAAQAQAGRWYEAFEITVARELRRTSSGG